VDIVRKVMAVRSTTDGQIDWSLAIDPEVNRDLIAPDVEIDLSRRVFNPEVYRGLEGLARLRDELLQVWTEWRMTPVRFLDVGDRVVLIEHIRGRARGSGVELDIPSATIWTLLDGRVTRVEGGLDPDEALKAVGLEA